LYSSSLNPQNDSQFALLLGINMESTTVTASAKSQKSKQQDEIKNWISFNPAGGNDGIGIGVNYEYMFNSKISMGANIYWHFLFNYWTQEKLIITPFRVSSVGIDASFRFYPWGKTFFLGTALSFRFFNGIAENYDDYYSTYYSFAPGITPEIGWKIDVGKKGGLFIQWGLALLSLMRPKYICDDPRFRSGLDDSWYFPGGYFYFGIGSSF